MFSVVFDMDGVLLDTERCVIEGYVQAASGFGLTDMDFLREVCVKSIGTNKQRTTEIFLENYGPRFDYESFRRAADEAIRSNFQVFGIPVKKGAQDILRYLHSMGVRIGLCTSTRKETVVKELTEAGLYRYFDAVVTGDMVGRSKPEPDIYLKACEELGVEPGETFAIEDSINGIRSACAAGMKVLMVPDLVQPTKFCYENCTAVFKDLNEVRKYLTDNMYGQSPEAREADRIRQEETAALLCDMEDEKDGENGSKRFYLAKEEIFEDYIRENVDRVLMEHSDGGYVYVREGKTLKFEQYEPAGQNKGTIVILHGFSEFTAKYRELCYYFLQDGYRVFIYDQRGHGASSRDTVDDSTIHVESFGQYVEDLELIMNTRILPEAGNRPVILYGCSMGGTVAALYLKEHPDTVNACILSAPMVGLNLERKKAEKMDALAKMACVMGKGNSPLGGAESQKEERENFITSNYTSEARYRHAMHQRHSDTRYQTGTASCKWYLEARKITKLLLDEKGYPDLKTRVIVFQAERDQMTDTTLLPEFASRLGAGEPVLIPGSKHDIGFSSNDVLENYLNRIFEFLDGIS